VLELARDPQRREALKAGASALAIRDADQRIAREILKILNTTESHT
jgi:UDP-N-acetylglucosamine:LPS N-acetylglucosamine transferase